MTWILFVNIINELRKKEVEVKHPSLGTLYLASYLKAYGGFNNVKILEVGSITEQTLKSVKPDITLVRGGSHVKLTKLVRNTLNGVFTLSKVNAGDVLKPRWLWFGVTEHCNSRCTYCNIWKTISTEKELTSEELLTILKSPLFSNVRYVLNSGGEPTLRKDLIEIFSAEHEALPKATLQLSTNAIMVDRAIGIVDYVLTRYDCNLDVGISLDGIGVHHDNTRGIKGNFERVDTLLKELQRYMKQYGRRLNVTVGATLTDTTIQYAKEIDRYAKERGVQFIFHWFNQSSFYSNTTEENQATVNIIADIIKDYTQKSLYRNMWLKSLTDGKVQKFRCYALNTFCVLKSNGDVAPCLSMWNDPIGNTKIDDPVNVWCSQKARLIRSKVLDCSGCLNNWGVNWSLESEYLPLLRYAIKRRLKRCT